MRGVHALRKRGWSISAVARHVGRDRKTVRVHLGGERAPGERRPAVGDPFDVVEAYVRQRLADDPHVWGTALFDEVKGLGYGQSYPTFVRKVRERRLRPVCGACSASGGRAVAIIDHPAGVECRSVLGASGRYAVGICGVGVGGCVVLFGSVPGVAVGEPGSGASGGRHRRGAETAGGIGSAVADVFGWRRCWYRAQTGYRPRLWGWQSITGLG